MNRVFITVRATRDAEDIPKGGVKVNVAYNDSWKDKATGEKKQKASFMQVVAFNYLTNDLAGIRKGQEFNVEGKLSVNEWNDQNGNKKSTTCITPFTVIIPADRRSNNTSSTPTNDFGNNAEEDEDIPF